MIKYSMWVETPDFYLQSSNSLDIIKAKYAQVDTWLFNMGFPDRDSKTITLVIVDSLTKRKVWTAIMAVKNRPLAWKQC